MQLIRFGTKGHERPGLLQPDGIVDLRAVFADIPDIDERFFSQGWPARLAGLRVPGRQRQERLGPPVAQPSKIICLGKNYMAHAKEGGFEAPDRPLIFCKTPNTLNGPYDPVLLPQSSDQVDWEVELALIIGKAGKRIRKSQAMDHIAGFTVMNDVSARRAQFADSQWFRGKSFDTFAPVGPALVTLDEIGDPHDLRLTATVNGECMQSGTTADLIFDLPTLIADISQDITLVPGDILSTGTPAGVGFFRNPPVVLKDGDEVACRIERIGEIRNLFVSSLTGEASGNYRKV
ncbi:MAG: fumarylacetoacetate hydrolase family protein [Desulfatitalea sp.]|nr:fumarylacetoacetate hydrolase family protein [Desulfatitalea sp.]NNK02080.1 fumarylacetoacetate hydrolase family protein [Desulfatitalea sp.]